MSDKIDLEVLFNELRNIYNNIPKENEMLKVDAYNQSGASGISSPDQVGEQYQSGLTGKFARLEDSCKRLGIVVNNFKSKLVVIMLPSAPKTVTANKIDAGVLCPKSPMAEMIDPLLVSIDSSIAELNDIIDRLDIQ
jgi:hypothetical protein